MTPYLTLTSVVFEFGAMGLRYNPFNNLTLTSVVFEYNKKIVIKL